MDNCVLHSYVPNSITQLTGQLLLQGNVVSPPAMGQPLQPPLQQQMIRQVAHQLMSATAVAPVLQQQQLFRAVSPGAAVHQPLPHLSLQQQHQQQAYTQLSPLGVGDKRPLPAMMGGTGPSVVLQQQPTLQQQQLMKLQEQRSIQQIQQHLMASAPPPMPLPGPLTSPPGVGFGAVISPGSSPPVRKRLKMGSAGGAGLQLQLQQQPSTPAELVASGNHPVTQSQRQSYGQVGSILMQTGSVGSQKGAFASSPPAASRTSQQQQQQQRSPGSSSPSHSVSGGKMFVSRLYPCICASVYTVQFEEKILDPFFFTSYSPNLHFPEISRFLLTFPYASLLLVTYFPSNPPHPNLSISISPLFSSEWSFAFFPLSVSRESCDDDGPLEEKHDGAFD